MKHKMLALILALTVVSWAQTSTQTAPADPQQNTAPEKAKCACCDKMASADAKDAKMSCSRHGKHEKGDKASCCAGKEAKSCCGGKDGMSCMKDDKNAASCCKDCGKDKTASACCGKECKEGCSKKTETAMNCCRHASHS